MSRPKGSKNKSNHSILVVKTIKNGEIIDIKKEFAPRSLFKATLKVLGRMYESEGNTIDEVLNNFKTDSWVKGAGVLIVTKDGKTREKIIAGNHLRNIFGMASGTMRTISLKWVKQLFE